MSDGGDFANEEDVEAFEDDYQEEDVEAEEEGGEDEEDGPIMDGDYNTDLPTTHGYLGKLESVQGYTLFDPGERHMMLGVYTTTMVFPGYTLPLMINSTYEINLIESFLSKGNVFVMLCVEEESSEFFPYGVTMEVYETVKKDGLISLKARGRQRCRLVPGTLQLMAGRMYKVVVQILADRKMPSPIADTQLCSLKRRRLMLNENYADMMANYKFRRYHLSQFPQSSWVYDYNEVCFYVKHMIEKLKKFYDAMHIPTEPVALSYWFAQNFSLKHGERLEILKLETDLERLRLETRYMQKERVFCCAVCKVDLADQADVFPMSKDGVQNNFCNPGGYVYETVTTLKARNYQMLGIPSKEFSWFPGFAWTIMRCARCRSHIGWRFTAKNLRPDTFFGFAKSGLYITFKDPEVVSAV